MKSFIKKWANPGHFLFIFVIISLQLQIQIEKSVDGMLGIRTRGAGWWLQTKPLSYGGLPMKVKSCCCICKQKLSLPTGSTLVRR